jgi:hypothetical protein
VVAATEVLEDLLVFGDGRDFAGALLFPSSIGLTGEEVLAASWPVIEHANRTSLPHSRLARMALVVVPKTSSEPTLEKSSKGTVMRRRAEARYAGSIETVYDSTRQRHANYIQASERELVEAIADIFAQVLERRVNTSKDLFHQGVDSTACAQSRRLIDSTILPPGASSLPWNIVYEQETVDALVQTMTPRWNRVTNWHSWQSWPTNMVTLVPSPHHRPRAPAKVE